ncbi:unnamed protein product, partial [Mesorhabditis belari]|uniref:Vitellogenin n=1 Tax=Mesorhabditis belari TaxID=2138241 RepID=A0AAF3EY01_9BILA
MRLALVAALCGIALAATYSSNQRIDAKWFSADKEFIYGWESQLSSGLPIEGTQHATQRISSKIHLQIRDRFASLQLRKFNLFASQETLRTPSRLAPTTSFEPIEPSKEQEEFLSLPVRFRYESGRVSELEFDSSDPTWSRNIKRAAINMLQVNMESNSESRIDETEKNYRVKETTLEGQDCEVVYAKVEELKKWNDEQTEQEETVVSKTIDFNKCTTRPDVFYTFRMNDECRECDDHVNKRYNEIQPYQPSTMMRFRLSGSSPSRFLIREVELQSTYVFSPIDDKQPIINNEVVAKLTLLESGEIKSTLPTISPSSKTTLMHSNKIAKAREQWEMNGDEKALREHKTDGDYEEAAKKTIDELKKLMKENVEVESSHMFSRLISILRRSTYTQIEAIHRYSNQVEESLATICVDAIAEAGTKVCVDYLVKLAVNEEVTPIRAAFLFKSLSAMRLPSETIIMVLDRFAKDSVCENNPILKQSVRLTQGALINALCVPNKSKWAHSREEVCPRELKEKMVEMLNSMYNKASNRYEKTLALKTIANSGLEMNIIFLEKIIYDKTEENTVRMQAMDALRLLRTQIPRRLVKTLMPIYKSRSQPTEIRITALFHLLHTMPERMVLEQVADQINNERNGQVAAYSYRMLKSFLYTENPCEKEFAERCKIALRLVREEVKNRFEKLSSSYTQASIYSEMLLSSGSIELSTVFSNDSVLPKELMASMDALLAGYWNKNFLQVGITQQGLDRVLRENMPKVESIRSIDDVITRGKRSFFEQPKQLLQGLFNKLSIVTRRRSDDSEKDPHATIYIRYRNMDYALIPLDEQIISKVMQNVISGDKLNLEQLEQILVRGTKLNVKTASMIYEVTRIFPTTFGITMMVSTKMPVVSSIQLNAKADLLPKGESSLNGIRAEIIGEPSVTITHLCQSMTLSPIVHTGIKLQNSILAVLPIDVTIQAEYRNKEFTMETIFKSPREEKLLFKALTRPVTYIRKVIGESRRYAEPTEKIIYVPRFDKMNKEVDFVFGEEMTGMGFHLTGNVYTKFDNYQILPIVANEKQMEIRALITDETPREYKIQSVVRLFEDLSLPTTSVFDSFFNEENRRHFAVEKDSTESFEESEREELVKKNSRKFNQEPKGTGHSCKITIESIGGRKERKAELSAKAVCDKDSLRMCHFSVEARRSPLFKGERDTCKAHLNAYTLFPEEASSLKELKEQKHREFHSVIQGNFGCEKTNEFTVKVQAEQNKEMRKWINYVDTSRNAEVDNFKLLKEAGYLNQYKIDAEYNIDRSYEKVITHGYRLLRSWNWWNTDLEIVSNSNNRVSALVEIEPENRRYVNLTINTPETKMSMRSMRCPFKLPLLNVFHPVEMRSYKTHEYTRSACEIRSTKIRTFDEVLYKTPLTTCYTVVAKDCSHEQPSFSVLVKKIRESGEEKMLKVITKEKVVEMWMEKEELMCEVNGKKIKEESLSKHDIVKLADRVYKIELEELSVRFDGRVVRVELSQQFKGVQCGLCGHYDDDRENEFRRADNEHTEDLEEFHRSYLAEECKVEEEKIKEKKNYGRVEESSSEELSVFEEIDLAIAISDNDELIERQQVIEYAHRTCFSRTAIKECPRGEPFRSEKVNLRFVCFPRESKEALQFIREIRRGPISLESFQDSFVQGVKSAIQCRA